ncbi:MAG: hypothetical protein AMXMBFR82_01350 [Candidatus Hydrogenedentota bacterium]
MGMKLPRGPAIRALLWEDWRRSRVAFLVALALGLLFVLTNSTMRWASGGVSSVNVPPLVILPVFLFGMTSLFSLGDFRELSTRIPARHRTLPVHPIVVATLHLGFRVAAIGLLSVVLVASGHWFSEPDRIEDYLVVVGIAVSFVLLMQCLAWSVGNFGVVPFLVSLVVFLAGLIAYGGQISALITYIATEYSPLMHVALWAALQLFLAGVAIGASLLTRFRQSDLALSLAIPRLAILRKPLGVSSALREQTRYEWVRGGALLPLLTLGFTTFAVAATGIVVKVNGEPGGLLTLVKVLTFCPLCVSPAMAVIAGLRVLLDDRLTAQSGLGAYVYSHPLSTQDFALSRLRMSFRSVMANQVICWCLFVSGLVAIMAIESTLPGIIGRLTSSALAHLFFFALGHTLLVWSMFWLGIPAIAQLFWCVIVISSFASFGMYDSPYVATLNVVPPSILLTVWALYIVKRTALLKILDRRMILGAAFAVVTALLLALWPGREYLSELVSGSVAPQLTILAGLVALALCPAIPILAQPLLVHRLRHR